MTEKDKKKNKHPEGYERTAKTGLPLVKGLALINLGSVWIAIFCAFWIAILHYSVKALTRIRTGVGSVSLFIYATLHPPPVCTSVGAN